jgi:RNA polymerase sigma factor (sigma-70 family)
VLHCRLFPSTGPHLYPSGGPGDIEDVLTEEEAIAAMRAGDPCGLDIILCLHQVEAVRIAFAVTGERAAAEDATSDAFLKAYDHIQQFDTARPFKPWLLRIVVNEAKKTMRRFSRTITGPDAQEVVDAQSAPADQRPDIVAEQGELRELVMEAMANLSPTDRAVLALRYYADLDERAIADTIGCSLNAAKIRLVRVRRRFRKHLLAGSPAIRVYLHGRSVRDHLEEDGGTVMGGSAWQEP